MPNTISNFLVGIGLDTTDFDKGARKVDSGLGSISKSALQLGAVVAGAFGVGQLTMGFADAKDELGKFSQVFGVIPNEVAAIGRALEHEGGSLESFMSELAGIERLRASTPQEIGSLFASAGIVGVDPSFILDAKNATEAYLNFSKIMEGASGKKRLQIAKVFNLSDASVRLLSNYRQKVDDLVEAQRKLRPITAAMTQEAARFNDETQDLLTGIGSIADDISIKLLPPISDAVEGMNNWISANREVISSGIDETFNLMGDSLAEISLAVAAIVSSGFFAGMAGLAKSVPLVGGGLSTMAVAAKNLSLVGAAGAAGYAGGSVISENLPSDVGTGVGRAVANTLAAFGNESAIQSLVSEASFGGGQPASLLFPTQPRVAEASNQFRERQRNIEITLKMERDVIAREVFDINALINSETATDLESSTRD